MRKFAVLSVDHAKANFYLLIPAERPQEQWSPILRAMDTLINTQWLEQKNVTLAGGNRFSYHVGYSGMAQTMHGYDDHLERHRREIARRFAKDVGHSLKKFIAAHDIEQLVIVAERKMLGELRAALSHEWKNRHVIIEVTNNLTHLSPVALHTHLARSGALPQRTPPVNQQNETYGRTGQWRRRSAPLREGRGTGEDTSSAQELTQPT